MSANVVLLANDWPGVQVARILRAAGDRIIRLYLPEPEGQKSADEITREAQLAPGAIFTADKLKDPAHVAELRSLGIDWFITVYWAHLLKPDVFTLAKNGTVNFHPAPLPINRGWFPHVHSILDGSPIGVTLHKIEAGADTGPIWAQEILTLGPEETAKDVYDRLQRRIVELFAEKWPAIRDGLIQPQPQIGEGCYHRKKEIETLDEIDLNRSTTARTVLNQLRARSFGSRGFAYFDENGKRYFVRIQINQTGKFS
jgi:methionyl-tRNA formyltransferase